MVVETLCHISDSDVRCEFDRDDLGDYLPPEDDGGHLAGVRG